MRIIVETVGKHKIISSIASIVIVGVIAASLGGKSSRNIEYSFNLTFDPLYIDIHVEEVDKDDDDYSPIKLPEKSP